MSYCTSRSDIMLDRTYANRGYGPSRSVLARIAWLMVLAVPAIAAAWADEGKSAVQFNDRKAKSSEALVFAAIGPELRSYVLNTHDTTLSQTSSVTLPAVIQAGVPHPSGQFVYVAWSDGTSTSAGSHHGLSTFTIDPNSDALQADGTAVALPSRPIYVSADPTAQHLIVTFTVPSGITVHPLADDGTPGAALAQSSLKFGNYGHQFLVDPTSTMAVLIGRGNYPSATRTEDPGELDSYDYKNGLVENRSRIAPNDGAGFHPRSMGFHPTRPWLFVSLSSQNKIGVYETRKNGSLSDALFEKNSLADPEHIHAGQLTGVLRVHPNGKFVYLSNRATTTTKVGDKSVFAGGENNLAVYKINQRTGEPTLIQNADTHGIGPVEFAFDPSGKLLVVANMMHMWTGNADSLQSVASNLSIFRVGRDGKLEFVRKYDIDTGDQTLFWMGVSAHP